MTNNKPAFAATIVVAIAAIAVAVFAFWKIAQDEQIQDELDEDINSTFIPTDELINEMNDAAEQLIRNSYTVLKLYYTQGLPKEEEPYGNRPENGIYFVKSDEYKTLDDVTGILYETFFKEEAERIQTNPNGSGSVYMEREGRLGISENFEADKDYNVDWSNLSFVITVKSATLGSLKVNFVVNGTSVTETVVMSKIEGRWLLNMLMI